MNKKIIGIILCVCMVMAVSLSACGKADDSLKEYAGRYDLVGIEYEGYKVQADALIEGECYLNLTDDGKGEVTFDEDSNKVKKWSVDGTTIEMKIEGSGDETGTIEKGIITIDMEGGVMYFAPEGTDVSGLDLMTYDELFDAMMNDAMAG